jgi:predicted permease
MTNSPLAPVQISGRAEMKPNERPLAIIESVTTLYFRTMKIPLMRGREFTEGDNADSVPVAIIDDSMAHRFWPQYPGGSNPIGQYIQIGTHLPPTEIVGIVADIKQQGLTEQPLPGVCLPTAQQQITESAMLAIRTEREPLLLVSAVRNQILALDHDQPVSKVLSMTEVVNASQGPLRSMMTMLAVFAMVATIIAVIGLYGVVSYSVVQRTKEIGIRRALGAQSGNILGLVVGHGLRLALGGLLLGLCGAFALTRLLKGFMFHVSTTDPFTYIAISALFLAVALAASYFPARRAASIDPLATLRL